MYFLAILVTYTWIRSNIYIYATPTLNLLYLNSQHMSSMEGKVCSVPDDQPESHKLLLRLCSNEFIFIISGIIALLFMNLPMEYVDGNPAPTFIFKGQPYTFHAFLVCVTGAFCGSVCSMHLHDTNPKAARIFRRFRSGATLSALVIFLWTAAPAAFNFWLCRKIKLISAICLRDGWHWTSIILQK